MQNFKTSRFYIDLNFKDIFLCIFGSNKKTLFLNKIKKTLNSNNLIFYHQARVGLFILLNFLKKKNPDKKTVILSPYTLTEVINSIKYTGCNIKFIDIDIKTGLPNLKALRSLNSKKYLCLILTNLFTKKKGYNELLSYCKKKKIKTINDNAINLFLKKNSFFGSESDFSLFSFNYQKNLSSILGGMIYFKKKRDYLKMKKISDQTNSQLGDIAILKKLLFLKIINFFFCNNIIYNFFTFKILKSLMFKNTFFTKLIYPNYKKNLNSNITKNYFLSFTDKFSYFGLKSLKNLKHDDNYRKKISKTYSKIFKKYKYIDDIGKDSLSVFLEYPIKVKSEIKDKLYKFLLDKGFEVRIFWYTNNSKSKKFKSSHELEKEIICFPTHKKISKNYLVKLDKLLNEFNLIYL